MSKLPGTLLGAQLACEVSRQPINYLERPAACTKSPDLRQNAFKPREKTYLFSTTQRHYVILAPNINNQTYSANVTDRLLGLWATK